jgi:hypothetical protein
VERTLKYKIAHVIASWGVGIVVLVVGYFRFRVSATSLFMAFSPGVAIILAGEYLRRRYLAERSGS